MSDNTVILHVNDIKLDGDDRWTLAFNLCSDYWQKSQDESLSDEDRKKNFDLWLAERQRLESGIY